MRQSLRLQMDDGGCRLRALHCEHRLRSYEFRRLSGKEGPQVDKLRADANIGVKSFANLFAFRSASSNSHKGEDVFLRP